MRFWYLDVYYEEDPCNCKCYYACRRRMEKQYDRQNPCDTCHRQALKMFCRLVGNSNGTEIRKPDHRAGYIENVNQERIPNHFRDSKYNDYRGYAETNHVYDRVQLDTEFFLRLRAFDFS